MHALRAVVVAAVVLLPVPPGIHAQSTGAPPAGETPMQFYHRYVGTVLGATSVDEITALWTVEQATAFDAAPPSSRPDLDELKKIYSALSNVKMTVRDQTATTATLAIEAVSPDKTVMTGTARLTRENGVWKLAGPERWK